MVRIGIVGIGFMGMIHYLAARKLKGARVTAICSRDPKKLTGDWRGIRGNFGPTGQKMDLSKIKKYDQLDTLLEDPDIDLVDVCNPTHLHAATATAAEPAMNRRRLTRGVSPFPSCFGVVIDPSRGASRRF